MMNPLFMSFLVAASAFAFIHEFDFLQLSLKLSYFSALLLLALAIYHHMKRKPRQVYLVDFACYKPNDSCVITKERVMETAKTILNLSEQSLELAKKILDMSGIGPKTDNPQALLENPPNMSLVEARKETEGVFFSAIDELLEKTCPA